ncbi:MAG: ATP-binding protein [Blautia sp.]|nr:ATP-binding protein [Blautia sp.]
MKDDYISTLRRNARLARECKEQAEEAKALAGGHCRDEAELYLKASDYYRKNVEISTGEERAYNEELMNEYVSMARKIAGILKAKMAAEAGNTAASGSVPAKSEPAAAAGNTVKAGNTAKAAKSSGKEEIDTEAWFRPSPKHGFDDVAGMESIKAKLSVNIGDAKYIELKKSLNLKNLNGFFFYGPPGCGKTYIVEAFANELIKSGYHYICLDAKDILDKYVGRAEKIVGRLMELAEESAPCIVFIDELDGVCKNRSLPNLPEYASSITTAFLTGYNRLVSSDKEIIFIGASNYPEKVDSAMLSRMELIRIPLPDKAARAGNLKYALDKSDLQYTMPVEEMAAMTENFDCRDLNKLVENCSKKAFDILKGRYPDGASASEALRNGEVILDREFFQEIFDEYMPFPKEDDRKRLEAWEKEIYKEKGVPEKKPEKKTGSEPEGGENGGLRKMTGSKALARPETLFGMKKEAPDETAEKAIFSCGSINLALVTAENDGEGVGETEGFFQDMVEGIDEAGRRNVHNPVPEQDIEKTFFYADKNYPVEGAYWQENAIRYQELLTEEAKKQKEKDALCQKMQEKAEDLNEKLQTGRKSFYMGQFTEKKGAENFRESYDSFNTVRQGAAVAGFGGTCGIVASCNVVNQQTGKRLREEDGVTVFVSANLCYVDKRFKEAGYRFADDMGWGQRLQIYGNNGGTNFLGRKAFINANGVAFEQIVDTTFMKKGKIFALMKKKPEVTLELMAERFHNGESEILILKAQDLKQASLSNRVPSWQEPDPFRSNHATTVAGFSYTEAGEVAGVWINETGGFADSGRVFISAEKFNEMRMNTKGFSVEFTKKKEQGGEA